MSIFINLTCFPSLMFNILKKLFTKKEVQKEKISLDNLEEWFNLRYKSLYEDLKQVIKSLKDNVDSEIEKTKESEEDSLTISEIIDSLIQQGHSSCAKSDYPQAYSFLSEALQVPLLLKSPLYFS